MTNKPRNTLPVLADPRSINIWFAQIYGKIDELNAAIFVKKGFAFLETYKYRQNELLKHPLFESINALCGQIDNVVESWITNNNADAELAKFYHDNRILVEQKLSSLRAEIVARKPTFWEKILDTLENLIRSVSRFLPALPSVLIEILGIEVAPRQKFIRDRSDEIDDLLDGLLKK
jgi:hypothetical protein